METRFSKARELHRKDVLDRKKIVSEIENEFNKIDKIIDLGVNSKEILANIEQEFKEKTKLGIAKLENSRI